MKMRILWTLLLASILAGTAFPARIDFVPARDGFGFKNYRNEGNQWKDDLTAEDLVRMFGEKTSCKVVTKSGCVLNPAAQRWMEEMLEAMNIGRCEGIAVASLRMRLGLPFKNRSGPGGFQSGARDVFSLKRSPALENYFAYFWATQTFDEIKRRTDETGKRGPAWIAKSLAQALQSGSETFLLSFFKYDPKTNRASEGHSVAPIGVEETPEAYLISVYDNNHPGETRSLRVLKNAAERWEYNSKAGQRGPVDYIGDRSTATLTLTANSWREGRCFESKWRRGVEPSGCSVADNGRPVSFVNASYRAFAAEAETADFFLTDEGDMLITDPSGKRAGYDPEEDYFFEEIAGAQLTSLIGGFFEDAPHYTLPFIDSDTAEYNILFSGRYIDSQSELDFVYAAPYFTVGFTDIRLDPNETLEAVVSADGQKLTFTASADSETPEVFFAFDDPEEDGASYIAIVDGVELAAETSLSYEFDFENGKMIFSDDDGNEDAYDIELIRVNADGSVQRYVNNDFQTGKSGRYEMDFGDWDGKDEMCFKYDDDADGEFTDEPCDEEDNEADGQ